MGKLFIEDIEEKKRKELRLTNLILGIPTANATAYVLCRTSTGMKSTPVAIEVSPDGVVDFLELLKHRFVDTKDVHKLYAARIVIKIPGYVHYEQELFCTPAMMMRGSHYTFDFPDPPIILQFNKAYGT